MVVPRFTQIRDSVMNHASEHAFICVLVCCSNNVPGQIFDMAHTIFRENPDDKSLDRLDVWNIATALLCDEHCTRWYRVEAEKRWHTDFRHIDFHGRRPRSPIATLRRSSRSQQPSTPSARRSSEPIRPSRLRESDAPTPNAEQGRRCSSPILISGNDDRASAVAPASTAGPSETGQAASSSPIQEHRGRSPGPKVLRGLSMVDEEQAPAPTYRIWDDAVVVRSSDETDFETPALRHSRSSGSSSDDSRAEQSFNDTSFGDTSNLDHELEDENELLSRHRDPLNPQDCFRPTASACRPPENIRRGVFEILKTNLPAREPKTKYVYVIPHLELRGYVKIGLAHTPHDRFDALWKSHGNQHINRYETWVSDGLPSAEARRLEQLVHADLAYHRRTLQIDGKKPSGRTEWFEVDMPTAETTVALWQKVMERYEIRSDTIASSRLKNALNQERTFHGQIAKTGVQDAWIEVNENHDARVQWWTDLLLQPSQVSQPKRKLSQTVMVLALSISMPSLLNIPAIFARLLQALVMAVWLRSITVLT